MSQIALQQTLEQQRAKRAWSCVRQCLENAVECLEYAIREANGKTAKRDRRQKEALQKRCHQLRTSEEERLSWRKKYGSLARRLPMLVLTNGLGQTLAFLKAKGKDDPADEHTILLKQLSAWVLSQVAPGTQEHDLLAWVLQKDTVAYRRATLEALAFLAWLKRFAEAEIPSED